MTTETKTTEAKADELKNAYMDRHVMTTRLVAEIRDMLFDMPIPSEADWGHVGTLGEVHQRLSEIRAMLGGK